MKKLLFLILLLFINYIPLSAQTGKARIIGEVIDEVTQEPIPGVNVTIAGTALGAATDIDGKFSIANLEIGTYQVRLSAVGYNTIVKPDVVVSSAKPTELLFKLSQTVIEFEGITVKSDFFSNDPTEIGSIASFSYEEIRRAPGGFEDVVRALSVLPGVAQTSAGRNDLIVRGGAPSENLYIVDGFVVPNINHFGTQGATGGPIGFINLDFVREASFSTGGFSSLYGDKLSSVLTIDLREGRKDKIGGKGTISASQFGFNLEGPIGGKGNFLFSARRSYLDFIFDAAGFNFVPQYYDLLSKFTYNLDSKNRISYLFIGAFDNVKFNNETSEDRYENSRILGSDQNTYITGLSYRRLFDKGFLTLTLSRNFTDFDSAQRDFLLNPIFLNKSREGENELKADVVYKLSEASELNFGASAKLIKFNADIILPSFTTSFGETLSLSAISAKDNYIKLSSYLQYSDVLFRRVRFNFGTRMDYFDGIESKIYLSPRMAFSFMISDLAALNFSAGVYHQSPSYIWLAAIPTNKNLRAVRVNQFVLGYERNLREDIRMKLEGFYKDYSDYPASSTRKYLVLANTGAGFGGSDQNFNSFGFEPLVSEGVGDVSGIEFSMQKKSSETAHYAIFSLTYSQANFKGIDKVKRPGTYDQRWIINLSGGYIFNKKWEASLKFRFATGSPYTPFNSNGTQSVTNYNTARFKEFHSLDLRFDRRWNFDTWTLISYLDLQNVYNNKQSNTIRWDYRKGEVDKQSSIGILPSIGLSLEF